MLKNLLINLLYTFFFFSIFILTLIVARQIYADGIIFYQGIIVAVFLVTSIFIINFLKVKNKDINNALFSSFLLMVLFNSLVPTIVDRSISVAVISIIKEEERVSKTYIEDSFKRKFFQVGEIDKRIHEQEISGNIDNINGNYVLTFRGKLVHKSFEIIQKLFKTNKNLI